MPQLGLIGFPLSHSFSKAYFDAKFEKEKLVGWTFENFPIRDIAELPALVQAHPQLVGLAVTIPHKKTVLKYLDTRAGIPPGLNACNCIRISNGKLEGFNTDITGFEKSFIPFLQEHHKAALVLGNGGATAAVLHVLDKAGMPYRIVSRELHGQSHLTYTDLTDAVIKNSQVIINTTPLGMFPDVDSFPRIPYKALGQEHLLYDLVYNPAKTMFLQKGEQQGAQIVNGEQMLVLQAEENWRIWNE